MPELPDVEGFRRYLARHALGHNNMRRFGGLWLVRDEEQRHQVTVRSGQTPPNSTPRRSSACSRGAAAASRQRSWISG